MLEQLLIGLVFQGRPLLEGERSGRFELRLFEARPGQSLGEEQQYLGQRVCQTRSAEGSELATGGAAPSGSERIQSVGIEPGAESLGPPLQPVIEDGRTPLQPLGVGHRPDRNKQRHTRRSEPRHRLEDQGKSGIEPLGIKAGI